MVPHQTALRPLRAAAPCGFGGPTVDVAQSSIPSGKQPHSYGKSPCLIGKSTISMGHFQ